jgi:hypothetical protein
MASGQKKRVENKPKQNKTSPTPVAQLLSCIGRKPSIPTFIHTRNENELPKTDHEIQKVSAAAIRLYPGPDLRETRSETAIGSTYCSHVYHNSVPDFLIQKSDTVSCDILQSVGIFIRLATGEPMAVGSIPGRAKRCFIRSAESDSGATDHY